MDPLAHEAPPSLRFQVVAQSSHKVVPGAAQVPTCHASTRFAPGGETSGGRGEGQPPAHAYRSATRGSVRIRARREDFAGEGGRTASRARLPICHAGFSSNSRRLAEECLQNSDLAGKWEEHNVHESLGKTKVFATFPDISRKELSRKTFPVVTSLRR